MTPLIRKEFPLIHTTIINNYSRLTAKLFILPALLIMLILIFLYSQNALSIDGYIGVQRKCFFYLNSYLGQYPSLEFNLTQLGDAIISFAFLSIFIIYAPKIWEALIPASLVSLLFSCSLKNIFGVPRPAAMFDKSSFIIVGKAVSGHTSLPSGHSITIFNTLTILLFAFMPQKVNHRIIWSVLIVTIGLMLVFTRVGVGAHYPIDVITGSIVGYVSGITGIFISRKYKIWSNMLTRKYYPIFILFLLVCCLCITNRMINENLIIYYLSLASLVFPLYKIIFIYVQNIKE